LTSALDERLLLGAQWGWELPRKEVATMPQRVTLLAVLAVSLGTLTTGCGGEGHEFSGVEAVCALNLEMREMNERTLPADLEDEPYPDPAMLEENFVETVRLVEAMVDEAPDAIVGDLASYAEYLEWLSSAYAEFGYSRRIAIQNIDDDEYPFPETVRAAVGDWFVEQCGIDLEG
jgi:hypothetical protein